jgi:ABC-type multidrug transport system permease subunit
MDDVSIILLIIGNILFIVLFFYVLYLFGGMYQRVKKALEKLEVLEKKLKEVG